MHSFLPTQNNQYQDPILTEDHNSACKTNKEKQLICDSYCYVVAYLIPLSI